MANRVWRTRVPIGIAFSSQVAEHRNLPNHKLIHFITYGRIFALEGKTATRIVNTDKLIDVCLHTSMRSACTRNRLCQVHPYGAQGHPWHQSLGEDYNGKFQSFWVTNRSCTGVGNMHRSKLGLRGRTIASNMRVLALWHKFATGNSLCRPKWVRVCFRRSDCK